jgi:hypothetical protein
VSVEVAVINSAPGLALTPQAGAGTDNTMRTLLSLCVGRVDPGVVTVGGRLLTPPVSALPV